LVLVVWWLVLLLLLHVHDILHPATYLLLQRRAQLCWCRPILLLPLTCTT
jgi:hypothetical protein